MFIRFFIILYIVFFSFNIKSQNNSVIVFSNVGLIFQMSVNEKLINAIPQSNVKAFNLGNGWQKIKILMLLNKQEVILRDSFFINEKYINKEFTYVLIETKNKLKFNSIEEPSGPKELVIPEAPKKELPLVDNDMYGNLYHVTNNKPVFHNNYNKKNNSCNINLTDVEINYALNLFNKCNDDEIKLVYLTSILQNNCFTVSQLNQLITPIKLEIDRLNVSKIGYKHVLDKQNINLILPTFKFQTMKDSFLKFLKDEESIDKQKKLNCSIPISDEKLNEILSIVKSNVYENDKTISVKKQLINNCVNTTQAQKIMLLFTHDREKIEVLKSIYNVLTDKENLKELLNELQLQDSRDEFIKYVNN